MAKKHFVSSLVCLNLMWFGCAAHADSSPVKCYDNGWTVAKYENIKNNNFESTDIDKGALSLQLIECLSETNPDIRDGVAYQALYTWLRAGELTVESRNIILTKILKGLDTLAEDNAGVKLPFYALVLAELVRADRVESYLTEGQRQKVVATTENYIKGIVDFRGFEEGVGWRHAVAHASDIVLQMALNKNINSNQLKQLLSALTLKINPEQEHFYQYGEPERLARAVVYLMVRDEISLEYWTGWFVGLGSEREQSELFNSNRALVMRHNMKQFLSALYMLVAQSKNERLVNLRKQIFVRYHDLP